MEIQIQTEEESIGILEQTGKIIKEMVEKLLGTQAAAAKSTATAVKRSLMRFDQLNRLAARSGKGQAKNPIGDFIAALKDDKALAKLEKPLAGIAMVFRNMGVELDTTQKQAQRVKMRMEELALPIHQLIRTTGDFSNALMGVPPSAEYVGAALTKLDLTSGQTAALLEKLPAAAAKAAGGLEQSFTGTAEFIAGQVIRPMNSSFITMFDGLKPAAEVAMTDTKQVFGNGAASIAESFRGSWSQVLSIFSKTDDTVGGIASGVAASMKSVINRLITGINTAVVEPFSNMNSVFSKLKSFTVNGIRPFKDLNFSLSMPKIPLLASGAVLPANKPFLAMVGDQRHGTNIEAPLATIEQAVAAVMEDVVQAQLAGHNQTVQVLRQILEAVLGIRLDEDALGRAAQRYSTRQAMMTGGF